MITRDAEGISCSQAGDIGIAIGCQILWACECALQRAKVPGAFASAMSGQLIGMGRNRDLLLDPDPIRRSRRYFANSRSACR